MNYKMLTTGDVIKSTDEVLTVCEGWQPVATAASKAPGDIYQDDYHYIMRRSAGTTWNFYPFDALPDEQSAVWFVRGVHVGLCPHFCHITQGWTAWRYALPEEIPAVPEPPKSPAETGYDIWIESRAKGSYDGIIPLVKDAYISGFNQGKQSI